jgi:signal transduction histidine kinase
LQIVFEDSGIGPPAGHREDLFNPFYSGREAGRGRGLGLPTAWRLAHEHGGDVAYDPVPGGPTRFVLTLPRHIGSHDERPDDPVDLLENPHASTNGSGHTVQLKSA